ncbi:MAG: hypothetical protein ABJO09_07130 [Hyphomicrobiales bacterium]
MTFQKIKFPILVLGALALNAASASANTGAVGVYNPSNDSSPDAMTPGFTGLAKDTPD